MDCQLSIGDNEAVPLVAASSKLVGSVMDRTSLCTAWILLRRSLNLLGGLCVVLQPGTMECLPIN